MNDTLSKGETLFADGKIDEAEKCFLSLIENGSNCNEAYNNLGVIAFQNDDIEKSIDYFTRSLEIDPFYKDAIINYTDLLSSLNQLHIAKPLLESVAIRCSDDEEITSLLKNICTHSEDRRKVAIICPRGLESFLADIVDFLKARYEVRVCYSTNVKEIDSTIRWSDVVWLEWANELTINLTNHPDNILKEKQTICRLHSYEAFGGFVNKINWKNINALIFVAEHIKDIVIQQVPDLPQMVGNIHVVPNGINMDKFSMKGSVRGKDLAFFGSITYKKGPMLLLHAFRELVQKDNEYRLFMAGDFQEPRYRYYYSQMIQELGLEDNFIYDGKIKDVAGWLEDKQYIVCSSLLEGHPVGLTEAMARGLKPLIHNFVGARGIYPEKYIWNTIPEFVSMATEENYDPAEYRTFIETNYSLEKQTESIDTIITQMCKEGINHPDSAGKQIGESGVCT
ncbi:MAG: glycosyltransferase [Candidatus Scalindua rubra]|uniref:GDP-mannose:cellobiosyl-diphosphopolyprenol alpha-mannosyltransferase n=1 Tax=Candidatus Scalindua brodae TaxID=237368 RepID=A0A0B0EEE9_9BACT|nr:MAG: GDP-mannose:cellobiosyl-diphosphopolyprenol alpha-mannosyltransferase [Candidatus Scalindua brodae]MBZ0108293.1 glycosyltransferase [Candidatus Scalindua rubra]TWU33990.1 Glycosyl transferases group 1 [Candidatus Brocadiaceae bacterium S225]